MTRNGVIELHLFRKRVLFGLVLASLVLTGCEYVEFAADVRGYLREGYVIEGGNVLWAERVIDGADGSTFEVSTRHGLPLPWGRDKDRAIHKGSIIPGSHGPSFQAFSRDWAKDRDHVYFGSTGFTNWELKTKEAEIRTIESASVTVLESMDAATFQLIKDTGSIRSRYSDANSVYLGLQKVDHADPASFRKFERFLVPLWRDDQYLFHRADRLETVVDGMSHPARADDLREIDDRSYYTDGVGVWRGGNVWIPIPDADPETFEILADGFAKDAHHVWHRQKIVAGIDPAKFKIIDHAPPERQEKKIDAGPSKPAS